MKHLLFLLGLKKYGNTTEWKKSLFYFQVIFIILWL